jgi:protein-disulfide isomerase
MTNLKIPVGPDDHVEGPQNAEVTLVEYGDYQCPHCARADAIVKRIQKHFGKRLRFVFRNFPLTQAHPHAQVAAETAEFAAAHGKFWEMHDLLFENQERLNGGLFLELARKLGLSAPALSMALEEGHFTERVRADFSGGIRSGVNGTPTFFLNGVRYDGSWEFPELLLTVDAAVEAAGHPAQP